MLNLSLLELSESITSGLTPLRSNDEFWNNGIIPWLKTEQLGEKYIFDTNEFISLKALDETSIKLNKENTLSIAMYGEGRTRGSVSILKNKMTTNQACCNVYLDDTKADYEYVYYFLKTQYDNLRSLSSGVRKNLNSNDIKNFKINIPKDIEEQKKIANVLSSLDSKIELNNKINKELESMAKTLYDYWFVQFDFSDENGKPYKSSGGKMVYNQELKREIPDGWGVKTISELLNVVTGKEDANFAVENGKYPFFTCSENISSCDEYAFEGKAILIAGNGNFNVKLYEGKFNAYQRTYVLIPNDEIFYSVIFYAVKDQLKKLSNGSAGSIIKFITKGDVDNIPLILPKFGNDKIFNKLNNITALIEKNIEQNQELAKLRDWILPMLMNGQVRVK